MRANESRECERDEEKTSSARVGFTPQPRESGGDAQARASDDDDEDDDDDDARARAKVTAHAMTTEGRDELECLECASNDLGVSNANDEANEDERSSARSASTNADAEECSMTLVEVSSAVDREDDLVPRGKLMVSSTPRMKARTTPGEDADAGVGTSAVVARTTTETEGGEDDTGLEARLRAMERAVEILGDKARDAEMYEWAYEETREACDEARRDARAFCGECELEAAAALEMAKMAVQDARRAVKQQALQFEGVVDGMERESRHRVATATLKATSDAARAKLRATEALDECERYRNEVLRLQAELQRASDAFAVSRTTVSTTDKKSGILTSSVTRGDVVKLRWRLISSLALRATERESVRNAVDLLQTFAEQQLELELAKREQRSAALALEELNSLLIESRDEVFDLKSAGRRF